MLGRVRQCAVSSVRSPATLRRGLSSTFYLQSVGVRVGRAQREGFEGGVVSRRRGPWVRGRVSVGPLMTVTVGYM